MGVRKRFIVLPFLAALLAVLAACLPQPDEPVEWVQRPESIVIQVLNVDGSPQSELQDRLVVPDFTLYGDGALIFTRPDAEGRARLLEAELPREAIRDLLEFIVSEGFLEFFYDQPSSAAGTNLSATFIYVNTIGGANSVRAAGLGAPSLEESGKEFDDLRRLEEIVRRLNNLDPEAVGGEIEGEFSPEALLLLVQPTGASNVVGSPAVWPFTTIDLGEIAPPDSAGGERVVEGEAVTDLLSLLPPGPPLALAFQQGERTFEVSYRLLLPFEENFPEFDQP